MSNALVSVEADEARPRPRRSVGRLAVEPIADVWPKGYPARKHARDLAGKIRRGFSFRRVTWSNSRSCGTMCGASPCCTDVQARVPGGPLPHLRQQPPRLDELRGSCGASFCPPRSCGVKDDAPIQQARLDAQSADVVDVPDGVLCAAPHDGLWVEAGALGEAHDVSPWPVGRRVDGRDLARQGRGATGAGAGDADLLEWSIQGVLEGWVPLTNRAAEVCQALDLKFCLGAERAGATAGARLADSDDAKTGRGSRHAAEDRAPVRRHRPHHRA